MERLNLLLTKGPSLVSCDFKTRKVAKKHKDDKSIQCQYSLEVAINREKEEVLAVLLVKSESKNIPFSFKIKSQAKFKLGKLPEAEMDDDAVEKIAIPEVMPYVFSFAKEMVASLTRKAYLHPFYLPSADFTIAAINKTEG